VGTLGLPLSKRYRKSFGTCCRRHLRAVQENIFHRKKTEEAAEANTLASLAVPCGVLLIQ
jgi:hypothetical protein